MVVTIQHTPRHLFALLLLAALAATFLPPPAARAGEPFQKGISYAAWWSGQYNAPGTDRSLQLLQATGADWIALIVTGYQQTPAATMIDRSGPATPADDDLIHVIRVARAMGLKVMLKPHVDLVNERETGLWRGDIGTQFSTAEQWSAWFTSYRAFIEHYARLSQQEGVEQFCVGTELLGTTYREADWREVVAGVRSVYAGPLVYAALGGGEEETITWWDAVDYIGIDGYYALSNDENPCIDRLKAGWREPVERMRLLSARYGRPVLLTEIGYRSIRTCARHPWDSWVEGPLSLETQAVAYQAAFESLYGQPWLAGMFWWSWFPDRFISGPCDGGYSPYGKPAEEVLRVWYGGSAITVPPIAWGPDYSRARTIYADDLAAGWQDWSWNADVELSAVDRPYSGGRSVAVDLGPWGGFSLWHAAFESREFAWLEFYVRGAAGDERLNVFLNAADGTELDHVPVHDCRHISGGRVEAGVWKRVRIPLAELNWNGQTLTRINIQERSGGRAGFWIDDIRLLPVAIPEGLSARLALPLLLHGAG